MDRRSVLVAAVATATSSVLKQLPEPLSGWETWVLYHASVPIQGDFTYHDDEDALLATCT